MRRKFLGHSEEVVVRAMLVRSRATVVIRPVTGPSSFLVKIADQRLLGEIIGQCDDLKNKLN